MDTFLLSRTRIFVNAKYAWILFEKKILEYMPNRVFEKKKYVFI